MLVKLIVIVEHMLVKLIVIVEHMLVKLIVIVEHILVHTNYLCSCVDFALYYRPSLVYCLFPITKCSKNRGGWEVIILISLYDVK